MSFTTEDYQEFIKLLAERPEYRSELRRIILSEDLLSLPEIVRELAEAQRRTEKHLEELAEAQKRTEVRLEELAEAQKRTEVRLEELAEAQKRTEDKLEQLIDVVKHLVVGFAKMEDKFAAIKGQLLEMNYREKAGAYFGGLLKGVRVINPITLEGILESHLSVEEFKDVLLIDLLVAGKTRTESDPQEVYLAVEISSVIDKNDVERAERRATLLRKAQLKALPAAAGEQTTFGAEELAAIRKIVLVLDGQIQHWQESLQTWGK